MSTVLDHSDTIALPSQLGLGCASAWGQSWFDEGKAIAIATRPYELGITVFDTGPSYSGGNAEPRLGKVLPALPIDKLIVSTKVGTHIGRRGKLFHDLSRELVLQSVEASRKRLGLDTIPLLYLHATRVDEFNSELRDTLLELRQRGCIGDIGVNSFDTVVLHALEDIP